MSISVADPDRLPSMNEDERDRKLKVKVPNSYKLPGQTWMKRVATRPTVIRPVGTQNGTLHWAPGKQPAGLTSPPSAAELAKTCISIPRGAFIPYVGEYWIIGDSATANEVEEVDGSDFMVALQTLGMPIAGSGGVADVRDADADADFAAALLGLVTNSRLAALDISSSAWHILRCESATTLTGLANAVTYDGLITQSVTFGRDTAGSTLRSVEAANADADADFGATLVGLLANCRLGGWDSVTADWLRVRNSLLSNYNGAAWTGLPGVLSAALNYGLSGTNLQVIAASNFDADSDVGASSAGMLVNARLAGLSKDSGDWKRVNLVNAGAVTSTDETYDHLVTMAVVRGIDPDGSAQTKSLGIAGKSGRGLNADFLASSSGALNALTVNARQRTADLYVEATAAANTAVTLTLPAPAAGLRQHIVAIEIEKFATALLAAAAAPVIVTSTNLVGNPTWNFAANAAAQGSLDVRQVEPGYVITASAAATAVTIVAPATVDVIFKIKVHYLVY